MTQQELGIWGENHAREFLAAKGYKILAGNFRFGKLELDLVCEFNNKLVVVEVKTRQTAEIGEPWRAVTRGKQRQIIRASNFYIEQHNVHLETQFDVISIVHNSFRTELEHIEDAFGP
ncbi:MAG: YraN family protein [Bacteroidota bacterium]